MAQQHYKALWGSLIQPAPHHEPTREPAASAARRAANAERVPKPYSPPRFPRKGRRFAARREE